MLHVEHSVCLATHILTVSNIFCKIIKFEIKLDNDSKFNQSTVKQKIDKFKETLDLVYMLKSDKDLSTHGIELPELQINNVLEKWEEETQSSL